MLDSLFGDDRISCMLLIIGNPPRLSITLTLEAIKSIFLGGFFFSFFLLVIRFFSGFIFLMKCYHSNSNDLEAALLVVVLISDLAFEEVT